MKKITILFCLTIATLFSKAQSGHFLAYGFSTADKTLYISYVQNVSSYSDCEEENYRTRLKPKECLQNSMRNALKTEVGSKYFRYDINIVTRRNSSGYGPEEYFPSKEEAERKRKEIMAEYSERAYKIIKIDL